jgi:hypothetical protein
MLLVHLVDESVEDFRAAITRRTELVLQTDLPGESAWVIALPGARVAMDRLDQCVESLPS